MPRMMMSDLIEAAIGGGEDLGRLSAAPLLGALAQVATRTATRTAPARLAALGRQWSEVARGRSDLGPEPRDWRFSNRAWSEHPGYRRLGQAYLAWSETVMQLVEDAGLDWRTEARARFAATLLTSALAPSNQLLLNPDAIERAWETAGMSLLRGVRNMVRDVADNGGLPRSVAPGAFTVGRDLAATAGATVHANELCELLQYAPATGTVHSLPVVVVPPQINKYYVMDLAPGRSFIEYAVRRGFQVFAVSWRNPGPEQRAWGLDTYVAALEEAIRAAVEISGGDAAATVSVCAGGITTAALLAHLASTGEKLVRSATFAVTHLDYDVPSMIGMFGEADQVRSAARTSRRAGVLPQRSLGALFALLRPNDLVWNYWVNNNLLGEDPPSFDVLAWNADGTALPAQLHTDFLDIFERNTLARRELVVQGLPADLGKVDCNALIVGARNDHLVPWKACYATSRLLGGETEFVLSSSGHIQSLVNPPGTPRMTITTGPEPGDDPERWLASAEETPGVWWEHWASWQENRAGGERPAPTTLGSPGHPPGEPAPGRYVLNG